MTYLATQDMTNLHEMIVDHTREMVCRPAIRLDNDEVVLGAKTGRLNVPKDQVRRYAPVRCGLPESVPPVRP